MDVGAANATDTNFVVDPVGSRVQKLFQDFLEEWQDGEELKYLKAAQDLLKPERNTMVVSMRDVERFEPGLAQSIQDEYYRLYPYLCAALKNYVTDRADTDVKKEYFIAFSDVDASLKVRDLTRYVENIFFKFDIIYLFIHFNISKFSVLESVPL